MISLFCNVVAHNIWHTSMLLCYVLPVHKEMWKYIQIQHRKIDILTDSSKFYRQSMCNLPWLISAIGKIKTNYYEPYYVVHST